MPAYNFQTRFAPLVASGEKRQTIRATGKRRHAAVGDRIQLYTGMRTKSCRKLVDPDPVCTGTFEVFMTVARGCLDVFLDGNRLDPPELDEMAQADGFDDASHMIGWFADTHGLPFVGVLITWKSAKPS